MTLSKARTLTEHDLELIEERLAPQRHDYCRYDISEEEMSQVKALVRDLDAVKRLSLGVKVVLGVLVAVGSVIVLYYQIKKFIFP